MATLNWDMLLNELENGKCLLCIGADVFSESETDRVEKKLAHTLRQKSVELGIHVYDDGWFHYRKDPQECDTRFAIKTFYEKQLPHAAQSIFADITDLPLHLILYFSPDYRLRDAFKSAGKDYEFASLDKNPERDKSSWKENVEGSKEKPLIFNMLGEINASDSLVMTYDDLFEYMEAIIEYKRMPHYIKLKIKQAKHFIFLGMPLDKWYFHLFMRVLDMHLHPGKSKSKRFAASYTVDARNATFCEEQYRLTFVQDDIATFVSSLKSKWQATQPAQASVEPSRTYEKWRNLIKKGEDMGIQKVLEESEPSASKDKENKEAHILLSGRWNHSKSTLYETKMSENSEKNQIVKSILNLIDMIEESNSLFPQN